MKVGQALRRGNEIAEYLGPADWFGTPGVKIRRMAGVVVGSASLIGGENWCPIPGRVVVIARETGRWTTPVERRLGVV